MKRGPRTTLIATAAALIAVVSLYVLSVAGVFDYDVWKRENPLVSPITITTVQDGTITLEDGRTFRPAGIDRRAEVAPDKYDAAIRVIVAQGVVVLRDLGDGRAFLLAEPRFYNSCGTRNMDGIPWKRWGGSYLQCPVSELLIQSAYAKPALDQPGLKPKERWRLEGVEQLGGDASSPTQISSRLAALKYDANAPYLDKLDAALEAIWMPPPP